MAVQVAGKVCSAEPVGRVCITRIPAGDRWDANHTGAKETSTFTVQIDNLSPLRVTTDNSGVFTNLPLASEHSVKIQLDGKPLTSFRFSFKERQDHLRLWYNPFYGSWSLSDVRPGQKCACPKAKASNQAASGNDAVVSLFRSRRPRQDRYSTCLARDGRPLPERFTLGAKKNACSPLRRLVPGHSHRSLHSRTIYLRS